MRSNDGGELLFAMYFAEQFVKNVSRCLVEVSGRLIGQQKDWFHRERPSNRHPLLLTTRQHPWTVVEPSTQAHPFEKRRRLRARVVWRLPGDTQWHLGVLERRELREKMMKLKNKADL